MANRVGHAGCRANPFAGKTVNCFVRKPLTTSFDFSSGSGQGCLEKLA
jgi:hypothetical protein